ncbi:MAG: chromate transporter [Oscillospiraceae bacterium]|nr:chromate transporter [Oscillospiraceae bacterium]
MIYLELFLTFFMIGAVTFGGGYAMLPMIQEQVALRWGDMISNETLIDFVAVSESTPGPFAINMATYVGSVVGGQNTGAAMAVFGSFCATLGVVLPSFIVILIVAKCYDKFRESRAVKGCMSGLKPAVVGLIASTVLSIGKTVLFSAGVSLAVLAQPAFYVSAGIFAVMAILAFKKVHPIFIICLSAAAGIAAGYLGIWG